MAKNWGLSPPTIHNILKRFRESRETSVCVGQGRKPQLNVHELWAFRWHCIKNSHAVVLNITTWAQEYLTQSTAASINATWISVILGESYTQILCSDALGFSGPQWKCVVVRWVHIPTYFRVKRMLSFQSKRPKGPSKLSSDAKANVCHGMGCISANGMGDCDIREGTIYMEA